MFGPLLLSSIAAGLIATAVMLLVLYLPRVWGVETYDVVRAIGSAVTGELNDRSVYIGAALYFAGGVVFALLYGYVALVLMTMADPTALPTLPLDFGLANDVNFLFPWLGMHMGLAHGFIVALIAMIVIVEHHPVERFRTRYRLIVSQVFSHLVYGAVVMLAHHQFLQLLIDTGAG